MSLPNVRPLNEWVVSCKTLSVGTSPVAAWCVAPVRGRVVRTDEPNASAESGDSRGVACVIDSYEFVRNS